MSALKEARNFIQRNPDDKDAKVLAYLIVSLEMQHEFLLGELYKMEYTVFKLALHVIADWRRDRYFASKVKLFDSAWQVTNS